MTCIRPKQLCSANRQRMILIVHLGLNMITLLDFSRHMGSFICMQTYFLAILYLDEIVPAFDTEQFALNSPAAFCRTIFRPHVLLLVIIGLKALLIIYAVSFHEV